MGGKAIYPGFIDAHCHFYNYGLSLGNADLIGTNSFQQVLDIVVAHGKSNPDGWLIGRGWDQNDWKNQNLPNKVILDSLFPDRPVLLHRIYGPSALANTLALKLAGIIGHSIPLGGVDRN